MLTRACVEQRSVKHPGSVPCGGGTQTASRTVIQPPLNGGVACPTLTETQACNTQNCCFASVLPQGERLLQGQGLMAAAGAYKLKVQEDGNVVLFLFSFFFPSRIRISRDALCAIVIDQQEFGFVLFGCSQIFLLRTASNDRNIQVLYCGTQVLWATMTVKGTPPTGGLILQSDGNLVLCTIP
jgi:hypothetical protein